MAFGKLRPFPAIAIHHRRLLLSEAMKAVMPIVAITGQRDPPAMIAVEERTPAVTLVVVVAIRVMVEAAATVAMAPSAPWT